MTERPNDRPQVPEQPAPEDPKLYVVINGQKFLRPGLETFFAQPGKEKTEKPGCSCDPVVGAYCSCNKVCRCVPACGCVAHTSCSCVGHRSGRSGGGGGGCRCAPVH